MADVNHDTYDHTGIPGAAPAEIVDIPTAETNAALVLAPDGAGGVEFRAEAGAAGALLASKYYKPATQQNPSTASTTLVDVDATNLAVTFTAPASGKVIVRLQAGCYNTGNYGQFGVREGTTNIAVGRVNANNAAGPTAVRSFLITGISAGSHTYKFAFSAGGSGGTMNLYYQTDDPAVASASIGPASIEVWAAA